MTRPASTGARPRQSVLGGGVAEVQHAGPEGVCAQELERDARLVRSESVADCDRVYQPVELVKEALAQQPALRSVNFWATSP
jgi:hypothetical protein